MKFRTSIIYRRPFSGICRLEKELDHMRERLQKILSSCGIASRREAELIIQQGRVSVNGIRAKLGESADLETDIILLDGVPLNHKPAPIYVMLYKPRGFVTTMHDATYSASVRKQRCGWRN